MKLLYSTFALTLTILSLSGFIGGCSILIGEVKPVDQKANEPKLIEIQQLDPSWKKLQVKPESGAVGSENEDIPDAAWQSTKTAAVISMNSACRQTSDAEPDIRSIIETITSGWDNLKILNQVDVRVSNFPGIETTAEGMYTDRRRRFQLLVVKSPSCVYDIIYLSPIETFSQDLELFQRFRATLKLK